MRKSPPIGKRAGLIHSHTEFGCTVRLHRQLFATAATAGSQNPTTVLGRHAGTEAMHLAALTLFGLVCTEHDQHSSETRSWVPGTLIFQPVPENSDSPINISESPNPCQALFWKFADFLRPSSFTSRDPKERVGADARGARDATASAVRVRFLTESPRITTLVKELS